MQSWCYALLSWMHHQAKGWDSSLEICYPWDRCCNWLWPTAEILVFSYRWQFKWTAKCIPACFAAQVYWALSKSLQCLMRTTFELLCSWMVRFVVPTVRMFREMLYLCCLLQKLPQLQEPNYAVKLNTFNVESTGLPGWNLLWSFGTTLSAAFPEAF